MSHETTPHFEDFALFLKKVRPGSIVVLHDGGGDRSATVAAVPQIIDALRECGYSCVTVSELLELK